MVQVADYWLAGDCPVGSRTGTVLFPNLFLRVDYQGLEIPGYHNDIGQWLALATSYSSKEQDSYQG